MGRCVVRLGRGDVLQVGDVEVEVRGDHQRIELAVVAPPEVRIQKRRRVDPSFDPAVALDPDQLAIPGLPPPEQDDGIPF